MSDQDPSPDPAHVCRFDLDPADNVRLANLCGPFDEHLRQLERSLDVRIDSRGNRFQVRGKRARAAGRVLRQLYSATEHESLSAGAVHLYLRETEADDADGADGAPVQGQPAAAAAEGAGGAGADGANEEPGAAAPERPAADAGAGEEDAGRPGAIDIGTRRSRIRTRGRRQRRYVEAIRERDVSFGIGPAGTGKTYLAVACAVEALESERVRRLVLVRPAVEAGERLGFLPGDLAQKVDPYLRPLYDALYEMLGFERVGRLIERGSIEIAPLAYMRGRTLNESFIILDEAQNTTGEQMKMFLTRIGFGSRAVITGDVTQIDLPRGQTSGLVQVQEVLRAVEEVAFVRFTSRDVVRHRLVAQILDAYEAAEEARDESGQGRR